ncbi:MAG: hypothetical protein EPN86_03710 [Nanoarchaeota archaeon]|nr:MAG: hypothetical protein EPN86_03710 [Nanoarchaeota archaeon]
MISTIITDFGRVILQPIDETYHGELNPLHRRLSRLPGYDLHEHFRLDYDILRYFCGFKSKYGLHIYTNGTIHDEPCFRPQIEAIFDGIHSAETIGVSKRNPQGYMNLAQLIGTEPSQIIFIDDAPGNVAAARAAGLMGIRYVSLEQLAHDVEAQLDFYR